MYFPDFDLIETRRIQNNQLTTTLDNRELRREDAGG